MNITYVHQYFRRPEEGGALRSWRIASALAAAGHQVTMITAHQGPGKVVEEKNLRIYYLSVSYASHFSATRRIISFFRFLQRAKRLIRSLSQPDLVYLTSTPLTVGFLGPWVNKKWNLPYIFEVRDLWPEAPIQMGAIRQPWLIRWLRAQEKKIYQEATHLIALSPGMKEGILQVIPERFVSIIPNMADMELFGTLPFRSDAEQSLGLTPSFRVTYTGAMGPSNGLGKLIALAKACTELPIEFVFAGTGPLQPAIKEAAATLPSIRVMGHLNSDGIRSLMAASDLMVVSFADIHILQTNSPNKFFDALAAGKPVLAATEGWIADLVSSAECGIHLRIDEMSETRVQLTRLLSQPEVLERMGQASKELAKQFDSKTLCEEVVGLVEKAVISDPTRL